MANKKHIISKRIVAILCCVAMLVTGVFSGYGNSSSVKAANTVTISFKETEYGFVKESGYNYVNVTYSGVSDFQSGSSFLTETFVTDYMTFAGGLTSEAFLRILPSAYLATSNTLQFLGTEVSSFPEGASFTILQGAQIPYTTAAGASATAVLDANYTFTFTATTAATELNRVTVEKLISSTEKTISLEEGTYPFNKEGKYINVKYSGIEDCSGWLPFFDETFASNYMLFEGGLNFATLNSELPIMHLADNTWFQLFGYSSSGLAEGASFTLLKGAKIPYNNTAGGTSTVILDANYTFTFTAPENSSTAFNQVTVTKATEEVPDISFGLDTIQTQTSDEVGVQVANVNITNHRFTFENYYWIALGSAQEGYIDYSGCQSVDAVKGNMEIRFILADANTQVFQFRFGSVAVENLQVGDQIVLKEGMPLAYSASDANALAYLDDTYTAVVTGKEGSSLKLEIVRGIVDVPETEEKSFGLDTIQTQTGDEAGVQVANVNITNQPFTFESYYWIALGSAQEGYIDYSGCQSVDAVKGNMEIRFILADANTQVFQFRFGSVAVENLQVGDQIVLKEGMPLAYSASDANALAYLDDTYTAVVTGKEGSSLKLEIVRGIVEVPGTEVNSFGLDESQTQTDDEAGVQVTNVNITDNPFTFENYYWKELGSAQEGYIDYSGCKNEDAVKGNMAIRFILADANTQVFQFRFESMAVEQLRVGDQIVLKEGMPLAYSASDENALAYLDDTYTVMVTGKEGSVLKLEIVRGIVEVPETEVNSFSLKDEYASFIEGDLTMINAEYMTDAIYTGDYTWMDLLSDTEVQEYIRIGNYTVQELLDHNVKILFIPTAATLQFNMGTLELHDGDEIVLTKGMTIAYNDGGPKCLVLDDDYVYQVTERSNDYLISRIENYHVTITVDGEKRVDSTYREGSMIDVSGYANASKGKVMSIKVNGVSTQEKKLTVLEDMDIVIENRSDLCIVMFVDNGTVYYVQEYTLGTKNITLPDAPDMDGYDDSWETFELVNGVITVNAVHVKKSDSKPTVELTSADYGGNYGTTNESNSTGNSSPQTGDYSMWIVWSILCVTTATISVFLFERRKKLVRKDR